MRWNSAASQERWVFRCGFCHTVSPGPLFPTMAIDPPTPARGVRRPWGCAGDELQSKMQDKHRLQELAPQPSPAGGGRPRVLGLLGPPSTDVWAGDGGSFPTHTADALAGGVQEGRSEGSPLGSVRCRSSTGE